MKRLTPVQDLCQVQGVSSVATRCRCTSHRSINNNTTSLNNMNAIITYKEISDFIEKEFKIRPKFTTVDDKTFEVSYKPGVFMPTISVKFHIEAMRKDIVCLSYECGTPASLMIAGVVAYLEERIPSGIEVNTTDKRVNIYPQRFKQVEKTLEYVALSNITFEENSVNVGLSMV